MTNDEWIAAFRDYADEYMRNGGMIPCPEGRRAYASAAPRIMSTARTEPSPPMERRHTRCIDCGCDISDLHYNTKRCGPCHKKYANEYAREYRAAHKQDARCQRCGNPVGSGRHKLCPTCSAAEAERKKKVRPHSTCVDCGADITMLNWRAERCHECSYKHVLEVQRAKDAEAREARRPKCVMCGRPVPKGGRKYCASCRPPAERQPRRCVDCGADISETTKAPAKRCPDCRKAELRRLDAARQARRLKAGLCRRCGKRPVVEGGTVCAECRERNAERDRKAYAAKKLLEKTRRCPDCGVDLPDGYANSYCPECIADRCRKVWDEARRRNDG